MWPKNETFDPEAALDRFLALSLSPTQTLEAVDVWGLLDLPEPSDDLPWRVVQRLNLARLNRFEALRCLLLERHKIDLVTVRGEGYRIARPDEQVALAAADTRARMQTVLARGEARVRNTDTDRLTDAQRAERANVLARLDQLRAITRKQKKQTW